MCLKIYYKNYHCRHHYCGHFIQCHRSFVNMLTTVTTTFNDIRNLATKTLTLSNLIKVILKVILLFSQIAMKEIAMKDIETTGYSITRRPLYLSCQTVHRMLGIFYSDS